MSGEYHRAWSRSATRRLTMYLRKRAAIDCMHAVCESWRTDTTTHIAWSPAREMWFANHSGALSCDPFTGSKRGMYFASDNTNGRKAWCVALEGGYSEAPNGGLWSEPKEGEL